MSDIIDLGTLPVQHREVQNSESNLFLSYFKKFSVEEGGIASGFNHIKPQEYRTRLLRVHIKAGPKTRVNTGDSTILREVPLTHKSLNSGDVFICDAGMDIYQWNGSKASGAEKLKAAQLCRALDEDRKGLPKVHVFEEGDRDAKPFWDAIGGEGPVASAESQEATIAEKYEKQLYRLSDSSGKLDFKLECKGVFTKKALDSKDVFLLDIGSEVFVWIGKDSSKEEKRKGMQYAMTYLRDFKRPLATPITRVVESAESNEFNDAFDK